MALSTYADLTAAIVRWQENDGTEFDVAMDDMIRLAEAMLGRLLDLELFNAQVTGTLVAGTPTISFPSTLADIDRIEITVSGAIVQLLPRDASFIRMYWPTAATQGQPRYFGILGAQGSDTVLLGPTPDSAYAYTLHGPARPDSLVDTTSGTYLSNMHYDALFWATLMMAQIYEWGEGDARLAKLEEMFTSALPSAAAETYHARRSAYLKAAAKQQQAVP